MERSIANLVQLLFAAIIIVVLAIPAARYLREATPPSPPETRTDIVTPATNDPISFAISPDGRQFDIEVAPFGLRARTATQ